jgi:hypothetical protein
LIAHGALKVILGSLPYPPVTVIASRFSDGFTEVLVAEGLALPEGDADAAALGEALAAGSPSSPQAANRLREAARAATSRDFTGRASTAAPYLGRLRIRISEICSGLSDLLGQ